MPPIVILDNGAHTIKAGVLDHQPRSRVIANGIFRSKAGKATYVGHQLDLCKDFESLHYRLPFEKGYLTDWDAQKAIWDGLLSRECFNVSTTESSLLLTEPYFNLPNIQEVYDQIIFEEYEFMSYYRCTPAALIPFGPTLGARGSSAPECILVVDSGFSFTHVVPMITNSIVWNAVRRIDVGGKLLTNQLKELVSFRQWNMMEETHVVNEIKEACCYVTSDIKKDLEICHANAENNAIVQDYILPDFALSPRGRIREPGAPVQETDQVLHMNNERFLIPEILFRPDDVGLDQTGLPAAIAHSISALPGDLRGMFWANIVLVGGCTRFPGFRERLLAELRPLAPIDEPLGLYPAADPILEAYHAAVAVASSPNFEDMTISRQEYLEGGSNAVFRKFGDWKVLEEPKEPTKAKVRARAEPSEDATVLARKPSRGSVARRKK